MMQALRAMLAAVWLAPAALLALAAAAQPADPPAALDLREEVQRLSVSVQDAYGRSETRSIALTTFRPPGEGPFPLVVVNHGRASVDRRAEQGRQRYEPLARYFVSMGYAVFVPTRAGYGDTYGDFDPEHAGSCNAMRPGPAAAAAADQVLATVAHARTLPWLDATRWVVLGTSLGGFTTLATAARNPPGLVAAINFAGGHGGRPDSNPGDSCSQRALSVLWQSQGATATVPTLWLYWKNDRYWGADWPPRWAQAWRDGGGQAEFHHLPEVGADGHQGMGIDMDHWVPIVEAYLARAGLARSGILARPPATTFAAVDEVDKVPVSAVNRDNLYRRFLNARLPRAFAIGPGGAAGYASGDWALGRALGYCQSRRGLACKLYAVDNDVVWVP